ncbi:MAG: PP2C family protein-serine/threonine phosphatase [Bacteroidia bacterium]|nr:PP2C family protein-serine/threonine phosphatase [Bacteroidia bacterium]MDW8235636.1 PP2C family protein-serine/threonine phosphatase [Bacteroidia bacterium]
MSTILSEAPLGSFAHQLIRELEVRRGEAEALQEVVRLLAPRVRDSALLVSVASILRSRFGVERLAYIHKFTPNNQPKLAYFHNFPSISQQAIAEATSYETTSVPAPDSFLHKMGVEIIMPLGRYVGPNLKVRIVQPQAWWLLGRFADTEEEKASDLLYLEIIGMLITVYLENAFNQEQHQQAEIIRLRQRALEQEIALASRIQRRLLSTANPLIHERLEISTFHLPHRGVGGDLFDFIRLNDKSILLFIGDVSGKGLSAALVMSNLQGQIRTLAELNIPLPKLLSQLHRRLQQLYGEEEGFVTLFLGVLSLEGEHARLTYLNAGHPPLFLLSQKNLASLPATMPMIGSEILSEEIIESFSPAQITLHPKDILFAYTDGLVEQPNPQGELLSIERVSEYISHLNPSSSQELLDYVKRLWENHRGEVSQEDDISLITCRLL